MRRVNLLPLGIALAALPLVWAIQHWLRPGLEPGSQGWLVFGPLPNFVVGLCVPYIAVAPLPASPLTAARAFTLAALATLAIQIVVEVIRPPGVAATFDVLDIVGSVAGMFVGALLYRWVAPNLRHAAPSE